MLEVVVLVNLTYNKLHYNAVSAEIIIIIYGGWFYWVITTDAEIVIIMYGGGSIGSLLQIHINNGICSNCVKYKI